jgi:thymidine phosphorylase
MVAGLGGPGDLVENPEQYLPPANVIADVPSSESGWIDRIDTRELGMAVVELGGGRVRVEDEIDHSVGLSEIVELGMKLDQGDSLCRIHARSEGDACRAQERVINAISLSDSHSSGQPIVYEVIEG